MPFLRQWAATLSAHYRGQEDGARARQRRGAGLHSRCPSRLSQLGAAQGNLKVLKANSHGYDAARASIPREGPALLQGRAVCGQCRRYFRVPYAARRDRAGSLVICDRAHTYRREPLCQIAGPPIDEAIGRLIAEQMTPAAVELALDVRKEIEARHEEADRLRVRAIKRAQTEPHLTQRRFMLVDPNNRPLLTRSKANGTRSSACWPMPARSASTINSSSTKLPTSRWSQWRWISTSSG